MNWLRPVNEPGQATPRITSRPAGMIASPFLVEVKAQDRASPGCRQLGSFRRRAEPDPRPPRLGSSRRGAAWGASGSVFRPHGIDPASARGDICGHEVGVPSPWYPPSDPCRSKLGSFRRPTVPAIGFDPSPRWRLLKRSMGEPSRSGRATGPDWMARSRYIPSFRPRLNTVFAATCGMVDRVGLALRAARMPRGLYSDSVP